LWASSVPQPKSQDLYAFLAHPQSRSTSTQAYSCVLTRRLRLLREGTANRLVLLSFPVQYHCSFIRIQSNATRGTTIRRMPSGRIMGLMAPRMRLLASLGAGPTNWKQRICQSVNWHVRPSGVRKYIPTKTNPMKTRTIPIMRIRPMICLWASNRVTGNSQFGRSSVLLLTTCLFLRQASLRLPRVSCHIEVHVVACNCGKFDTLTESESPVS
jgi:hypothetical protein